MIHKLKYQIISLLVSIATVCLPTAAAAAERIVFNLAPFGDFQVKVADLEAFVATGAKTPELDYYLNRLTPQQVARLPRLLNTPLELNPLTIANFSNSQVGEIAIKNFAKGVRSDRNQNGFYALRGAIIAAAFDESKLTLLNLLHQYPLKTIHLDLEVLAKYSRQAKIIAHNRQTIERIWFPDRDRHQQAKRNNNSISTRSSDRQKQSTLARSGEHTWQKRTLTYQNPYRSRSGLFDLYQPAIDRPVPLIAISHGIASNRQTFAYLGRHLASYGFAVAIIEHDEIGLDKFDRFLAGKAAFPDAKNLINNPLDVSAVLDRLESEPNLDLQQVGVVGQSFGGYTALALSGGELIADETAEECEAENYPNVLLNLSSLAKCTFNQLGLSQLQLRDPRIKAVMAINPMIQIFGKEGISSVETPTMIVSGTHDLIMPAVAEQIQPFSWLNEDLAKYLVLVKPATHFSFLQEGLGVLPVPDVNVGPRPIYAYPALKALSTSFFQLHLARQTEYKTYLQSDRAVQFNNDAFELSIIRSIEKIELKKLQ